MRATLLLCACFTLLNQPSCSLLSTVRGPRLSLDIPNGWVSLKESTEKLLWSQVCALNLSIALTINSSVAKTLKSRLREVSSPTSSIYGQFWSLEELTAAVNEEQYAEQRAIRVEQWLQSVQKDVNDGKSCRMTTRRSTMHNFISVNLSPAQAEDLFKTTVAAFRNLHTGLDRFAATTNISVPAALESDIVFISGMHLPNLRVHRPTVAAVAAAKRHRAHAWEHGGSQRRQLGVRSFLGPDSQESQPLRITIVENRDRAFQVHLTLNASFATKLHADICGTPYNQSALDASPWKCPDGRPILRSFGAVATPTRHLRRYLNAVKLSCPWKQAACTPVASSSPGEASGELTCVVQFGPSLLLANYVPTVLIVRTEYANGYHSDYVSYDDFVYPSNSMTVSNVRKLYNIPQSYTSAASDLNSQAVVNFLNISINPNDTALFERVMGYAPQPPIRHRGQPNDPSNLGDIEGSIDVQWIQGIGQGVPTTYWLTASGKYGHEPFLDWLVDLIGIEDPALVQSISYGENEDEYSAEYEAQCNLAFVMLGLRGVTVLVASGDTGIQGSAQPNAAPPQCAPFVPLFPASSPYVTTVGGTQFSDHLLPICDVEDVYSVGTEASMPFSCPDDDIGEIVCSTDTGAMITTGGGISNRFKRPWYQNDAVLTYLSFTDRMPSRALFNGSGRGYPDVAAVGQNVPSAWMGRLQMAGGTSSSAPIVAGIISLLNGERLALGLPPMGFINPWLYEVHRHFPGAFNDILAGNNSGGNRLLPEYMTCDEGYPAKPGWDAATGLGSLDFQALLEHAVPSSTLSQRLAMPALLAFVPEATASPADLSSTATVIVTFAASQLLASAIVVAVISSIVTILMGHLTKAAVEGRVALITHARCQDISVAVGHQEKVTKLLPGQYRP